MDIGCGNWHPQGEWKCVCKSHFDKRGRRPVSSQPLCCLCLFFFQSRTEVFVPSNSCPAFASLMMWSSSIFIRTGERERETNFQQKQLNDTLATPTLATRPDPLPFGMSRPGHLACHHSADGWRRSAKDSDVMPTIILPTPSESTGKAKQACKVMGRSFKGRAVVSSLLAKESLHSSSENLSIS